MGARRMGGVPRLRGRSLRHRRRGHRAWPLSHRDLEQHEMDEPQNSAYLLAQTLRQAADRHQAKPHAIRRRWLRRSSRRSKRAARASAIRSVPSPSWIISCAARCRRNSSAEARRAISACRWRGGSSEPALASRSALLEKVCPHNDPKRTMVAPAYVFAQADRVRCCDLDLERANRRRQAPGLPPQARKAARHRSK